MHPVEELGEFSIERVSRFGKFALAFNRHGARSQKLSERVRRVCEYSPERDLVLSQKLADGRLDQSGGKTRLCGCGSAKDLVVQHGRLREIRHFRRTADDHGAGQQKVLEYR